ncbi:hypothetical protein ABIB50_003910 [Mucilaginibacter sp. UYCu711]
MHSPLFFDGFSRLDHFGHALILINQSSIYKIETSHFGPYYSVLLEKHILISRLVFKIMNSQPHETCYYFLMRAGDHGLTNINTFSFTKIDYRLKDLNQESASSIIGTTLVS